MALGGGCEPFDMPPEPERPKRKLKLFEDARPLYGQDPHVTPYQGGYLLAQSEDEQRITLTRLTGLVNLSQYSPYESHVVWDAPDEKQVWAPELHQLAPDHWVILYSFSDGTNATHRAHVLEGPTPFGPFTRTRTRNDWSIDQTTFTHNGKRYLCWSGWENANDEFPQHLYIAETEHILSIKPLKENIRSILTSPTLDWEENLVEAPSAAFLGDQLYLFYSGSPSWLQSYSTGCLRFSGTNVLDFQHWVKSSTPLATNTGHGHPIEDRFIYHTKLSPFPGWTDRVINSRPLIDIIEL